VTASVAEAVERGTSRTYEVYAVRYGRLESTKGDLFYRYGSYGEPDLTVEMAYYFWILQNGGETVVVDSGFEPGAGSRRGRECLVDPIVALRTLGVDPESVRTVIVTHLHYDHVGNLAAFPNADLIVPRRELEFWTSPIAMALQFAAHVEPDDIGYLQRAAADGRVRLTAGTEEILEGVTAIQTGGHSAGQQLTVVDGAGGQVVLASDAVHFYEELELERPFAVMHDLERMYLAYGVLKDFARAGAVVVPGHDPEVVRRHQPSGHGSEGVVRIDVPRSGSTHMEGK
jgi:glyoxylase-like metal-dependent hydrolase (beta-lactamase superfamily II)